MKCKCVWCGAENEAQRRTCRSCGLPVSDESKPQANPESAEPVRPRGGGRPCFIAFTVAAVLVALAFGGRVLWQRSAEAQDARQQQEMAERERLAKAEHERLAVAERQRAENAERQRTEEARRRIPDVLSAAKDDLRQGKFAAGLAAVNALLREIDAPELRETKIDLLDHMGRWNEAYTELSKLLQQRPAESYLHLAAANFALNLHNPTGALSHFEAATRLAPSNTTYQIALANRYVKTGRAEEGFALFEKLIADDPEAIDAWFNYGVSMFNLGRYESSVEIFRRAALKFPESSTHHFQFGLALDNWSQRVPDQARRLEAVAHYRKSLELHPQPRTVAAKRIYEITRQRVPPELEAMSAEEIPVLADGGGNVVRAAINGVEGLFILDTGASYTSVFRQAAGRFRLAASRRAMEAKVKTANGMIQVPVAYASVQVGQQKQAGAIILLLPESEKDGIDGLLGGDFLNTFDGQISYNPARLTLRGPKNARPTN